MTERELNEGKLLVSFLMKQKPIPEAHDHSWWVDQAVTFLADHYGYVPGHCNIRDRVEWSNEMYAALDRWLWEKLPQQRGDPCIAGGSALTGRE